MKNVLRAARSKLGYAKYVILDGGHRDVSYRWRIKRLDRGAERTLERLRRSGVLNRVDTPAASELEVHTLCGHKGVTMGIWSLWSFLRWCEGRVGLVVHSDGSLTDADVARFQEVFSHVRVVTREMTREWVDRRLPGAEYEQSRAFMDHLFGPRLYGTHMSEQVRMVVPMDTDVLFVKRPDEVLEVLFGAGTDRELISFHEPFDWVPVIAEPKELRERCGPFESAFNAGFVVMPRFGDEQFRFLEERLRAYQPSWRRHYFAEQVLLALAAGHFGWIGLPTERYRIADGSNSAGAVGMHYVSNTKIRPTFYTQGLADLVRECQGS